MRMLTEMEMGVVSGGGVNPPADNGPWDPIIWGEADSSQRGSQGESNACSTIQDSDVRDACILARDLCGDRTKSIKVRKSDTKEGGIGFSIMKRGGSLGGKTSESGGPEIECHPPRS